MIPSTIVIHHTDSSRDKTTLNDVNNWHKARDFNLSSLGYYVGYHYLIEGNGKITQVRKSTEIGCHCIPNEGKIGVALCGDFETETPSPLQLTSLEAVLEAIKKEYAFTDDVIFAHCEKSATLCPGKNLYQWLKLYRQVSLLRKILNSLLAKVGKLSK